MLSNAFLSRDHLKDAMKKVGDKPHPNIYEIIDAFKREEATMKMKMQMLEAGVGPKTKMGEAKREMNSELVFLILFWNNFSE